MALSLALFEAVYNLLWVISPLVMGTLVITNAAKNDLTLVLL